MNKILLVITSVVLTLSACSSGSEAKSTEGPSGSLGSAAESASALEVKYGCGSWAVSDLSDLKPLSSEAVLAIESIELYKDELGEELTSEDVAGFDLKVVSETEDEIVLFGPSVGESGGSSNFDISFDRKDGEWRPSGWGGCEPTVEVDGYNVASFTLDADNEPTSELISLIIQERECTSGQSPEGREIVPLITETEDAVKIIVLVKPPKGDAFNCPSNPPHRFQIDTSLLENPIDGRKILDGSSFTAVEQTWPPAIDMMADPKPIED